MSEGFQFIDIILFALVAGFLILRLRSVLGRRDGHQGRAPDPFAPPPKADAAGEKVVQLPDRADRPAEVTAIGKTADAPGLSTAVKAPLETGLTQIAIADPRFDPEEFLSGARIAFELVLNAFAAGDADALKPLLSPEVFGNFVESIRQRQSLGQRLGTKLVALKSSELTEAYMAGRTAHVTVAFVSQQISAVYDADGNVIDGDPAKAIEVTDSWTFARDTRSTDPNWALIATGTTD